MIIGIKVREVRVAKEVKTSDSVMAGDVSPVAMFPTMMMWPHGEWRCHAVVKNMQQKVFM